MNLRIPFLLTPAVLLVASAFAEDKLPEPPVPVRQAPPLPPPGSTEGSEYQQRLYAPTGTLVAPEKAKQVVDTFHGTYEKLNHPRLLIYVNRELVDEHSGLKLTGRREHSRSTVAEQSSKYEGDASAPKPSGSSTAPTNRNEESTTPGKGSSDSKSTTVTSENTYTSTEAPTHTLADKQTVREVERLFGRPF